MALSPTFTIGQSLVSGNVLRITDTTGVYDADTNTGGYGAPNPEMDDVLATRFIFSDYPSERDASTVSTLTAFKEYTTDTNFTYDTSASKTALADSTFIPQVDVSTVPDGTTITETGRRYAYVGFLPLDTFYNFAPSDLLIDDDTFPDRMYNLTYEVYTGTITSGNIAEDDQYIVISDTSTDRVTYNGNIYRPGEVFLGVNGTTTFTTTGSPVVSKLNASGFKHFLPYYHSHSYKQQLILKLKRRRDLKSRQRMLDEISNLSVDLDALIYNGQPNLLNITGATELIENIAREYNRIIKYDN